MEHAKIYLITNSHTGHRYVGFTIKPLQERWRKHLSCARRGRPQVICRAIRKHGEDTFQIEELYRSPDARHTLDVMEPHFIAALHPEYNGTLGGEGVLGYKHTEETKRKCGMSMKGTHHTDEWKRRCSEWNKGKIISDEHIIALKTAFGQPITIDGVTYKSKNDAALYAIQNLGMSRNTTLRWIAKGITSWSQVTRTYKNASAYTGKRRDIWHTTSPSSQ